MVKITYVLLRNNYRPNRAIVRFKKEDWPYGYFSFRLTHRFLRFCHLEQISYFLNLSCENSSGINYILNDVNNNNNNTCYFKVNNSSQYCCSIVFLINKYSLGEHEFSFKNIKLKLTNPKLLIGSVLFYILSTTLEYHGAVYVCGNHSITWHMY